MSNIKKLIDDRSDVVYEMVNAPILKQIREKQRAASKAWREKVKNDPEFKEKERLRQIAYQERIKKNADLLEKERQRKREWARNNKKQTN